VSGAVGIYIRRPKELPAVLTALKKRSDQPPVISYRITEQDRLGRMYYSAQDQAIANARKIAERMAQAAGARVVGILSMKQARFYPPDEGRPGDPRVTVGATV